MLPAQRMHDIDIDSSSLNLPLQCVVTFGVDMWKDVCWQGVTVALANR